MSLFSEVARPFGATTCPDGEEEFKISRPSLNVLEGADTSEWVVAAGCWFADTELELIDNSSCRFFSYSVCFPCCISSFVKLAASSPKKPLEFYFEFSQNFREI